MTLPDFKKWGLELSDYQYKYPKYIELEKALKQAFQQGRELGYREGYAVYCPMHSNKERIEWWEQQDQDKNWIESHNQDQDDE